MPRIGLRVIDRLVGALVRTHTIRFHPRNTATLRADVSAALAKTS